MENHTLSEEALEYLWSCHMPGRGRRLAPCGAKIFPLLPLLDPSLSSLLDDDIDTEVTLMTSPECLMCYWKYLLSRHNTK